MRELPFTHIYREFAFFCKKNLFVFILASAAYGSGVSMNASLVTALVLEYTDYLRVQIEVQHPSYISGGGRKLALYVNNEEKTFYAYPAVQYFGHVRVTSSEDHALFEISTALDGPTVKCDYVNSGSQKLASMDCVLFLSTSLKVIFLNYYSNILKLCSSLLTNSLKDFFSKFVNAFRNLLVTQRTSAKYSNLWNVNSVFPFNFLDSFSLFIKAAAD